MKYLGWGLFYLCLFSWGLAIGIWVIQFIDWAKEACF